MTLLRRHKYILTALSIYWPALFIATHMPEIPGWVRRSGMSDKTLHYMAYLALTSLAWLAISPYNKVNWKKAKVWGVLVVVVWYGALDEWLQGFVNRSVDIHDFYANLIGTVTSLIILSVLTFWPALLTMTAIIIFIMTNLTRAVTICQSTTINAAFYFCAYAFFALVWIQLGQKHLYLQKITPKLKWFSITLLVPASLLLIIKLASLAIGRQIYHIDTITALAGIAAAAVVSYITCHCSPSSRDS